MYPSLVWHMHCLNTAIHAITAAMPAAYSMTLASLLPRLRSGELPPTQLASDVLAAAAAGDRHHAWIHRLTAEEVLAQARRLEADLALRALPL